MLLRGARLQSVRGSPLLLVGARHWLRGFAAAQPPPARQTETVSKHSDAAAGLSKKRDFVVDRVTLQGSCECGSTGFVATGPSTLNFVCHCASCRAHSRSSFVRAAAFLPRQVELVNAEGMTRTPCAPSGAVGGPPSERLHCASCGSYLADSSPDAMGVIKLSLAAAEAHAAKHKGGVPVDAVYRPNHHIFYGEREKDIDDALPKWVSFPEGELAAAGSGAAVRPADGQHNASTGRYRKDVMPMSCTRVPVPGKYWYTENDAPVNHITEITQSKMEERRLRKYDRSPHSPRLPAGAAGKKYGAIVVGGGHNALVSAAYLAKHGVKNVLVLERRHLVGGAAVTEELVSGFKFSRASYLAGLLRPKVIVDLDLHRHGLKYLPRNPSSFTPTKSGRYLMLGADERSNWESIAQFDRRDADAYPKYEEFLHKARQLVQPILDNSPMNPFAASDTRKDLFRHLRGIGELVSVGMRNREVLMPFYELFTGPASHILDRWFESEILKTTLATDAVIGANISPKHNGSAYVLLHHVMGEAAGQSGVWAYVEGGMGAISEAIASSAREHGAEIVCNASVKSILHDSGGVRGVELEDGTKLQSDIVLSGTTPYHTFLELLPGLDAALNPLPKDFVHHIRFADYSCQAFKINIACNALPNFACYPTAPDGLPGPQHRGTTHFEVTMEEIENAYRESSMGMPATRPVVEMTIPSSLDSTVAPRGQHVVQLFVQYAPYDVDPKIGHWADPAFKQDFVHRCLRIVDEFCPGFSSSVIGYDALSPLDLERVFGLHKGSIHHGSLALHQLGPARPMFGHSNYRMPLKGLYLVGAGAHPGGGVMGAAGRNGARVVLQDLGLSTMNP